MFFYDIPQPLLQKYLEDIDKNNKNTRVYSQTTQINFPDIDAIYKSEIQKHGKKSLEFQLISYLRHNKYNNIAIYYALALAQTKTSPKWTFEDIISEIEEPTLITKQQYKTYLQPNYPITLSKKEQQEIAKKIWKHAIENETQFNSVVSKVLTSKQQPKFEYAHNINIYAIREALLNAFKLFNTIKQKNAEFDYNIQKYFNYKHTGEKSLNTYINELIKQVLLTLKSILNDYEISHTMQTYIQNIITILKETQTKNILWPHEDMDITSLQDLKKYFNIISSSDEPKRKKITKKI